MTAGAAVTATPNCLKKGSRGDKSVFKARPPDLYGDGRKCSSIISGEVATDGSVVLANRYMCE